MAGKIWALPVVPFAACLELLPRTVAAVTSIPGVGMHPIPSECHSDAVPYEAWKDSWLKQPATFITEPELQQGDACLLCLQLNHNVTQRTLPRVNSFLLLHYVVPL